MPFHFRSGDDPYDPDTNALRGLNYLSRSFQTAGGNARLALAGYNGGIGVISRGEWSWAAETARYVYFGAPIYEDAQRGTLPEQRAGGMVHQIRGEPVPARQPAPAVRKTVVARSGPAEISDGLVPRQSHLFHRFEIATSVPCSSRIHCSNADAPAVGAGATCSGTVFSAPSSGSQMMKAVPCPSFDSTSMRPLWRSTIQWEMDKPRPNPLLRLARARFLSPVKTLEDVRQVHRRDARPGIPHHHARLVADAAPG